MAEFTVLDANGADVLIGSFWVPSIVAGNFVPGAAYAERTCIGGLITVPLGHANTKFSLQLASLALLGLTTGIGVDTFVFEADPTSSTFTDGVAAVLAAADLPNLAWRGSVPSQESYYGASLPATFDGFPRRMVTTDAGGNLYMAFVSQGLIALTTPQAEWRLEARN